MATPPIRRRNTGRSHAYYDGDGQRVPGVTTLMDEGVPKPALVGWAANSTAEYAIDNWDRLADLPPSVRLKELQGARWAVKDKASNRGTAVHLLAERLVHGESVDVPEELLGYVQSYARFLDEWQVQPVLVEFVVVDYTNGYAATGDLIADLTMPDEPEPVRWLLDLKTSRSGIFGETALQLAGIRHAEFLVGEDGDDEPMPEVDRAGGIHVRADGYSLVPIEAGPDQHRDLLYVQQVGRFVGASRELVGQPLDPPGEARFRLVRDDG